MNEIGTSATLAGKTLAGATPPALACAENISVTCHENEVPPFVADELERLYGNIYASLVQWRVCGALSADVSTYVVRCGGNITALFLFRRENGQVQVLNEGIVITGEELQRFVNYIFSRYGTVGIVNFHAVRPDIGRLAFPCQRFNCLEDIVLALPATEAAYMAMLGSATRNYIKRYMNKAVRSFPSFSHKVYVSREIDEQHVRDIVDLNRTRMTDKGKVPGIDAEELRRIIRLVKECGLVSVVMIDGRVAAGTINYRVGRNYFLEVVAHDPRYNEYRFGTLCCYLTICACIARGGDEYHFLWGKNEYKYRLAGVERALDHLAVYRSRRQLFLNGNVALKNEAMRCRRRAQLWLQDAQRRDDWLSRFALHALHAVRAVRRA